MPGGRAERLRRAFWAIPAAGLTAGAVLGVALPAVEKAVGGAAGLLAFGGQPGAARPLLGAIATMTVSIIGLAFSVTLVALTLAAQQLSPRVLRTFRGDRLNQATLAAFLALAVYALLVLRSVRSDFVPGASISLAIAGTVVALGLFVAFVSNIVLSLQPATIIRRIGKDGRDVLAAPRAGEPAAPAAFPGTVVPSERAGYVQAVDGAAAAAALAEAGRAARICPAAGEFVVSGDPLAVVDGPVPDGLAAALRDAVAIGQERSLEQDVAFPVRQLADIALKALSPSLNDPTTAENALDGVAELLVRASREPPGWRAVRSPDGVVRLLVPGPSVGDLVRLGFDQVRGSIRDDPVMAIAVLDALARVGSEGEAERQAALVGERFAGSGAPAADRERVARRLEAWPQSDR